MIGRMLKVSTLVFHFFEPPTTRSTHFFLSSSRRTYSQCLHYNVLVPAGQATNYRFHSISPEQELSLHKVQVHPAKGSPSSWMSKDRLPSWKMLTLSCIGTSSVFVALYVQ
jgi:hypothetical protein